MAASVSASIHQLLDVGEQFGDSLYLVEYRRRRILPEQCAGVRRESRLQVRSVERQVPMVGNKRRSSVVLPDCRGTVTTTTGNSRQARRITGPRERATNVPGDLAIVQLCI